MIGARHFAPGGVFRQVVLLAMGLVLLIPLSGAGEEYSFDAAESVKKPYSFGGYGEFLPVFADLDRQAAFYKLKFYNHGLPRTTGESNLKLQLEGSYEKGIAQLYGRTNSDFNNTYQGWDLDTRLYEGYLSVKPSASLDFIMGKKVMKWGKGYAWNPAAFIDRPKNPDDPEIPREGYAVAAADYTKSFEGSLRTLSFTPVLLPVATDFNGNFGAKKHFNVAGKVYALLYDTDIDLMFLARGSKPARYGLDFSRNIRSNWEAHGEASFIVSHQKNVADAAGNDSRTTMDAKNFLLGTRYQTSTDAILIAEYYRNGGGYSHAQMRDFVSFVDTAYSSYLANGSDAQLQKTLASSPNSYGAMNPMRDYLYFRATRPDPFGVLYLTPALTSIVNLDDGSLSLAPEVLYTRITNLELRLKATAFLGSPGSEFGEKAADFRLELRARYYF